MPESAVVATTDAEIDAAIEEAARFERFDRRVHRASYAEGTDSVLLHLENGVTVNIPRRLIQGLTDANAEALCQIELLGRGTGLYWPLLDVAHEVSGLLAGIYGSATWMKKLWLQTEAVCISA